MELYNLVLEQNYEIGKIRIVFTCTFMYVPVMNIILKNWEDIINFKEIVEENLPDHSYKVDVSELTDYRYNF